MAGYTNRLKEPDGKVWVQETDEIDSMTDVKRGMKPAINMR